MLQREHSAILLTFINVPFVIKMFVLSIFEWPLKTGFTAPFYQTTSVQNLRIFTVVVKRTCGLKTFYM